MGDRLWLALARLAIGYLRSLVLLPMVLVFFLHGFFLLSLINPSLSLYSGLHEALRYVVPWLPKEGNFSLDATGLMQVYLWLSFLLTVVLAVLGALLRRRFEVPNQTKLVALGLLIGVSSTVFAATASVPTLPERFVAFGIVLFGSLGFTVFPLWIFAPIDEFLKLWESDRS